MKKKVAIASMLAMFAHGSVSAATYDLTLNADEGSRWYEYFSGAFYELGTDRGASGAAPGNDGSWSIADYDATGAYVAVGGGDTAFPTAMFTDIGTIDYDDSGLDASGTGSAAITGLDISFEDYVAVGAFGPIMVGGADYSTTVDNVSGTLDLVDGEVTGINLDSDVTLTYLSAATLGQDLAYSGDFTVAGTDFALQVDESIFLAAFGSDARYVWDVTGTAEVAPVPVPAAAWLFGSALLGLAGVNRKRRPKA